MNTLLQKSYYRKAIVYIALIGHFAIPSWIYSQTPSSINVSQSEVVYTVKESKNGRQQAESRMVFASPQEKRVNINWGAILCVFLSISLFLISSAAAIAAFLKWRNTARGTKLAIGCAAVGSFLGSVFFSILFIILLFFHAENPAQPPKPAADALINNFLKKNAADWHDLGANLYAEAKVENNREKLFEAAGYAGIGPILARTTFLLVYCIENRTNRVPYGGTFAEDYPWKYIEPDDKRKLLTQIEFWRKKMPEDLKDYLNARLAVSKQLVDFADKHFYKTPVHLLDGLNGFEKTVEAKHIQSAHRDFNKKWDFAGGYSYSFKMTARAYCSFPDGKESWTEMQKRRIQGLIRNRQIKQIKLHNADYAFSTLRITLKNKKMKNQTVQFKEIYGDICFLKNNIVVHVGCWGEFPGNEDIDPDKVAVRILANFKKPSVPQN